MAIVDAAICFFIPYYATRTNGQHSANDVFSVGKTVFTALLGSVTLEVGLDSFACRTGPLEDCILSNNLDCIFQWCPLHSKGIRIAAKTKCTEAL